MPHFHPAFDDTTAYLHAGGRGTRLQTVMDSDPERGIPKALIQVGRPGIRLIDHQLNLLRSKGFGQIVVGAGDQTEVRDYVTRRYSKSVVTAVCADQQYGTAGDLVRTVRSLGASIGDLVFSQNTDTILDINSAAFLENHRKNGRLASIALTTRRGVPNQDAFIVNGEGRVVYSAETDPDGPLPTDTDLSYYGSSTGALVLNKTYLNDVEWTESDGPISLDKAITRDAIHAGNLTAYNNGDKFMIDIGTPNTLQEAQRSGSVVQPYLSY